MQSNDKLKKALVFAPMQNSIVRKGMNPERGPDRNSSV